MRICVLGSGSGGNCTVVQLPQGVLLIDAGFGPRTMTKRLAGTGLHIRDISHLLLTHLDGDHFNPAWLGLAMEHGITIYLHKRHVYHLYQLDAAAARALHDAGRLIDFADQPFPLPLQSHRAGVVSTYLGAHDSSGVVAYRIETEQGTLAHATDLGRTNSQLSKWLADSHILSMESNYDAEMQLASPRPMQLKKRIMGGKGHLSNIEAYNAVRTAVLLSRHPPRHVVLLHLSRQCNNPTIARQVFSQDPILAERLHISSQHEPTPWLCADGQTIPLQGQPWPLFA